MRAAHPGEVGVHDAGGALLAPGQDDGGLENPNRVSGARRVHPGEVGVHDGGAPLAPGQDDGGLENPNRVSGARSSPG